MKKFLFLQILLISLHLTFSELPSYGAGKFSQFYNKGIEFYKKGHYEQAGKEFEKALELKPNDVYALFGLGCIYYCKEKYEDAVKVYTKAININPDYAKVHYSLSLAYSKLGMTREAEKQKAIFRKLSPVGDKTSQKHVGSRCVEGSPGTVKFSKFYSKGIGFYKQGNYDKAGKEFKKAIELNPDDFHAFYYLGNTYYCKAKYDDAVKVYTKTININPDYAKVHYSLSLAYNKLGMTLEAEEQKAIFRKLSQKEGCVSQNHTKLNTGTDHSTVSDNFGQLVNKCIEFYKAVFKKLSQREGKKPLQKHAKPYNVDDHSTKVALQKTITSGNQIGQKLINSVFDDQEGQPQSLLKIINGKKGFIYFYSGCCGHCSEQLIKVADLVKLFNDETIAIVGIQYMGGKTCTLTEQSQYEIKGMRISDAGGEICSQYGVGDFTVIVSNKDSVIQYRGGMDNINKIQKCLSFKVSEK